MSDVAESSRGNVIVAADESALAERLADAFIASARTAIEARGAFNVALAGGTTPKAAYELLATAPRRDAVAWDKVTFFFGDERCVSPDDEQSNFRTAKRALFDHLTLRSAQVHRMRGEEAPDRAAAAYALLLKTHLGVEPVFDLIMLGMGPDGHTASLFPGTDPLTENEQLVRAPFVEKFNVSRITITPHVINRARNVIIATAGEAKADALAAVLKGNDTPIDYPIQIVHPVDGSLTWLVDRAAAAKL